MKRAYLTGAVVITASATAFAFKLGQHVPFSEQWPLFEALRTTAAIIFAVVGAWLAIVFPERLKLSLRTDSSKTKNSSAGMGQLLSPAIHSTAILSIVLVIGVVAPLLKRVAGLEPYTQEFRGISYSILVLLTFWQLWTVILTLVPADKVKEHADTEESFQNTVRGYTSLHSKTK